jgi:hypothetical protein
MSKRPTTKPGVFTKGLKKRHFRGRSTKRQRLAAEAESARSRRIHWLRRLHPNNAKAQALATKLVNCRPSKRCKSGACPVCALAAQNSFVEMVRNLVKKETKP